MRRHLRFLPLLLGLPLVPYAACRNESTGKLRAETTGDLSHPQAERRAPDEELVAACGTPEVSARTDDVRRRPYLQSLGSTSVSVLWTTSGEQLSTQITTPEGEVVGTLTPERDRAGDGDGTAQWIARASALSPETIYCYSIINPDGAAVMGRYGFKTAPAEGRSDLPTRFVVLGDSGEGSEDQAALVEQIRTVPFDFMLHVGDMAYTSGTFAEFNAHYFDMYEELLPSFSVFPIAGNHEYDTKDAGPFRAVFDLPNNERWYSFDWGDVHFVGIDTEQIQNRTQLKWLENDLANRTKPWTVAYLHKPPYSSGSHGSELDAREAFAPLFKKYDVDLVIAGHDHHYERFKPIGGVRYIVTGGGGAATYPVTAGDQSAFAEEVIHFVYVTVQDNELLAHAIDGTGQEFDQLYIRKDVVTAP